MELLEQINKIDIFDNDDYQVIIVKYVIEEHSCDIVDVVFDT